MFTWTEKDQIASEIGLAKIALSVLGVAKRRYSAQNGNVLLGPARSRVITGPVLCCTIR